MNRPWILAAVSAVVLSVPGRADVVQVTVTGQVEFNQINSPPLGDVMPGEAATLTFLVNSNNFVDSMNFPVRGYEIDQMSFDLTLGGTSIGLVNPFPAGETPYFCIRNNDPAVDGFWTSTLIDFPAGVPLAQVGIFGDFLNNYSVTYTGDTLSSLDILDALGTYDFTNLQVFNWTIDDGPFNPMGIVFSQMTIASVSECFLVVGPQPGTTAFDPLGIHTFWPQVSAVDSYQAVLLDDLGELLLPLQTAPPFAGSTLVGDFSDPYPVATFAVQVLMWNPQVFPQHPEQFTPGMMVQVFSNGRFATRHYGSGTGMEIWAERGVNAQGQPVLRFPFSIPGF